MATSIDAADAIVAALNGASLTPSFTAVRAWVPVYDLEDLATLHVTVVPEDLATGALDLTPRHFKDWRIGVWIQERSGLSVEEVDPLAALAEDIIGLFDTKRIGTVGRCTGAEYHPVQSNEPHYVLGAFTAVVTLTVRVTQ